MNSLLTKNQRLFNEFFTHTIGLDTLFNQLVRGSQVNNTNFPPYNVIRDESKTFVELALAGYSKDDVTVVVEDGVLSIEAAGYTERKGDSDIHRGIASRRFKRSFRLGEYVEVNSAKLKDGMLTVELEEVLPPEKQPRTIEIK